MRRIRTLAFMFWLFILLAACTSEPIARSAVPPSKPSWHWEWAGGQGGAASNQFARDRYACLQDYRQTASPFIQRDQLTELQMMTLHQQVCLEGKGWKQVQDSPAEPKPAEAKPPGPKDIGWFWQGPPEEERAAAKRFLADRDQCSQDFGIANPDPQKASIEQLEGFMACMWGKKWGVKPVPGR